MSQFLSYFFMKFAILTVLAEGGKGYEPILQLFLHEVGHSGCVS
jgi:hypothetical protein